tara:strand:+ start:137 stop:499 length:363 start_codon:yes stop_codon:yes gene_type:complete
MKVEIEQKEIRDLLFYSFRYALGRSTYAVEDVADMIIKYWDMLSSNEKSCIIKEIEHSIAQDNYGMDMDLKSWQKVLVKGREYLTKPQYNPEDVAFPKDMKAPDGYRFTKGNVVEDWKDE